MTIGKQFEFEACHSLPENEVYGKCCNLHGHRYELDIEVIGEINDLGWVCNYKEHVIDKYDHANLNEFFEVPTAENMTIEISKVLTEAFKNKNYRLKKVKLFETSTSYAELCLE